MEIILIAAASENNVIGKGGEIPWDIPGEQKRFKDITIGHTVVMGRKTYESIGRLLPGRRNIILTRNLDFSVQDATICHSNGEVLAACKENEKVFIIGGEGVYKAFMRDATGIELTRVHRDIDGGDAMFPQIDESQFKLVTTQDHNTHSYLTYVRSN